MKPKWLILAAVLVIAGLLLFLGVNRSAPVQHFSAKVERGDIHDVVEATGTINSVHEVLNSGTKTTPHVLQIQGR